MVPQDERRVAQDELRPLLADFLDDQGSLGIARRFVESDAGYDRGIWRRMTRELGLAGLAVPETYGGTGLGLAELAVAAQELGRTLYCGPFFGTTVLATSALLLCDDEGARTEYLPAFAQGELTATMAVGTPGELFGVRAHYEAGSWSLSGTASQVIDGDGVDVVFVAADTSEGVALFAVERTTVGLTCRRLPTLDPTRPLATLSMDRVTARLIGAPGECDDLLRDLFDIALVTLAAESVGGAERCLRMSVDYAKLREQFGRPIGSFQAIKHKCADVLVSTESARSAATHAAEQVADPEATDRGVFASLAKAYCADAFYRAATENIQIHGGIGYTWEHDAHLFLKRAKSTQLLFGQASFHRERVLAGRI